MIFFIKIDFLLILLTYMSNTWVVHVFTFALIPAAKHIYFSNKYVDCNMFQFGKRLWVSWPREAFIE